MLYYVETEQNGKWIAEWNLNGGCSAYFDSEQEAFEACNESMKAGKMDENAHIRILETDEWSIKQPKIVFEN